MGSSCELELFQAELPDAQDPFCDGHRSPELHVVLVGLRSRTEAARAQAFSNRVWLRCVVRWHTALSPSTLDNHACSGCQEPLRPLPQKS
jgi:hypothetical protein